MGLSSEEMERDYPEVDHVIERMETLPDKVLARLYLQVQGEAYDRKLTEERMEEFD